RARPVGHDRDEPTERADHRLEGGNAPRRRCEPAKFRHQIGFAYRRLKVKWRLQGGVKAVNAWRLRHLIPIVEIEPGAIWWPVIFAGMAVIADKPRPEAIERSVGPGNEIDREPRSVHRPSPGRSVLTAMSQYGPTRRDAPRDLRRWWRRRAVCLARVPR